MLRATGHARLVSLPWLATHLSPRALTSFAPLRKSKIYGLTSSINVYRFSKTRLERNVSFEPRAGRVSLQLIALTRALRARPPEVTEKI